MWNTVDLVMDLVRSAACTNMVTRRRIGNKLDLKTCIYLASHRLVDSMTDIYGLGTVDTIFKHGTTILYAFEFVSIRESRHAATRQTTIDTINQSTNDGSSMTSFGRRLATKDTRVRLMSCTSACSACMSDPCSAGRLSVLVLSTARVLA